MDVFLRMNKESIPQEGFEHESKIKVPRRETKTSEHEKKSRVLWARGGDNRWEVGMSYEEVMHKLLILCINSLPVYHQSLCSLDVININFLPLNCRGLKVSDVSKTK